MATITQTRYTPEDLLRIDDRPMPELVDGQLLEHEVGQKSDAIAFRIGRLVGNHVDAHQLGICNGSQGSYQIFPDDPRKVRIPDVSFTRGNRVPPGGPADGHGKVAPDLVIEVASPNDSYWMVQAKVKDYLSAGVPLIWVLEPESRTILVYRQDRSCVLLLPEDSLDGEAVLPGFRCEVAALFA